MIVSPSIASSDVLHIADELDYINSYFDEVHIDIEDGVAVNGISFGMKMCKGIVTHSRVKTSVHLEVLHPLQYLEDLKEIRPDYLFVQVDHISDPDMVIETFLDAGIHTGIAIGNRDLHREYTKILSMTDILLVSTAEHEDENQIYRAYLGEFAIELSHQDKKIWVDGGINDEIYKRLQNSPLYASVMGRGIFNDKEFARKEYGRQK